MNLWILAFAKLSHEIYEIARKYHPQIKMDMIGWWWSAEDHRLFAQWADREAPGWVEHMYLHLPYGATKTAAVPLPKGCQRGAFVHISYAEQDSPMDMYGHLGPIIAAERLDQTVINLKAQGVTAIQAYSEGVFEDVNKAILAGLASGQYRTADEVLEAYAQRYFGVDADTAKLWAVWLKAWGKPFAVDTAPLRRDVGGAAEENTQARLAFTPVGVEARVVRHSPGNRPGNPMDARAVGGSRAVLGRPGPDSPRRVGLGASAPLHFRTMLRPVALVCELGQDQGC